MDKYLFQAVRFESLNYLRNIRRRSVHREEAVREMPVADENQYENDIDHFEQLYQAINRLPEERKKIFLMICMDEMKYQEVADCLNISKNTVKTQLSRALRFLREQLTPDAFSTLLFFLRKK